MTAFTRGRMLRSVAMGVALALIAGTVHGADPRKVLRVATADIETLDPQSYSESPSFDVLRAIYEGLYEVDYLADPPRYTPLTAAALPEISDDGRIWTIRVRPGIYFTDDPAFKGRQRELTADDYVYSLKRWLDPNSRRGGSPVIAGLIAGGREALDEAKKTGKFDLDRPLEGLRALDRYTLQLKLTEPNYPVIEPYLTVGAVPREVVEARGGDLRTYAVGTGPYKLKELKRGSRITLEANPHYRGIPFPESAQSMAPELARRMRGAPFPRIGIIELYVIEEDSTRLLEFDRGNIDYVVLRSEIATRALDRDKLRPEYAARGVTWYRVPEPFLTSLYFNLRDPVVGGMEAPQIALRRAIDLALDRTNLVDVVYAGQALPANQMAPPRVAGHDPRLAPAARADPAAARELLDRYGYKLGRDGLRTARDGAPLTITILLRSGAVSREVQTLLRKNLMAVGLRTDFHVVPFQDAIKELTLGQYQVWFGAFGGNPTAYGILSQLYSKSAPQINVSKFSVPDYDAAIERFMRTRDPVEQTAAARRAAEIQRAYMPITPVIFRMENYFVQPWLTGFRPSRFDTYWKYYDMDTTKQARGKPAQ